MQSRAALVSYLLLLLAVCPSSATSPTEANLAPVTESSTASLGQAVGQIQRDNADLSRDIDSMTRDMAEVRRDNAEVKRDMAEVKLDNAEVKRDNAALRRELTQLQGMMLRYLDSRCAGNTSSPDPPPSTSSGGATYVRWGRTSCPPETDLVYKGYAGGSRHNDPGAAVDYLCLPEHPQYASSARVGEGAKVYGAEYTVHSIFRNIDHDVPCAVCRSPTRSSAIMVPARTSCHPGFHREYYGYLMAGKYNHPAATEHVCVDRSPENVAGGARDQEGKQFYFAVSRCGSLKCPPYVDGRVLTCVVCSK